MILQIKTHNYNMLEGSIPVAFIFKIHYKVMFLAFANKHKYQSQKGETLLLQTNLSRSNIVVPKAIQWKDITLSNDWILEGATPPEIPQPPQPNVQIKDITQYIEGKVKLSFHHHSTSSRFSEESSSSSTVDLGRILKIPSVINIPCQPNPPKHSTSDIPSASFQHADYTINISKPVYTNIEQQSPPTSPIFSSVTKNVQNELNVLISEKKHFVLKKLFSKKIFMLPIILQNEFGFFNTFSIREVRSKNNFIISLNYIKYKLCSLIGSNCIMYLNITFHILLHPLNMHVRSHQDPKHLHGTSPVDQQLSLTIHP
jgi:hypothetical protein